MKNFLISLCAFLEEKKKNSSPPHKNALTSHVMIKLLNLYCFVFVFFLLGGPDLKCILWLFYILYNEY